MRNCRSSLAARPLRAPRPGAAKWIFTGRFLIARQLGQFLRIERCAKVHQKLVQIWIPITQPFDDELIAIDIDNNRPPRLDPYAVGRIKAAALGTEDVSYDV